MATSMDKIVSKDGWCSFAQVVKSPHFNQRPANCDVNLLVIHNISLPPGKFGSSDINDFFQGKLKIERDPFFEEIKDLKVSAHCLIRRDGQVVQYVSFDDRAWHAGVSIYQGCENCNDFSIGIEMEGTDTIAYSDEQYESLVKLTDTLLAHYPKMDKSRITGHSDIAPGRKTDPGPAFDWQRYLTGVG